MLKRLEEIAPGVWVATSRRYRTCSTVLADGHGGALVVDPAWDADELAALPSDLATLGLRCAVGFATHVHYDHVLWHADLGEVPRWASPWTAEATLTRRDEVLAPLIGDLPASLIELAGRLRALPGEDLPWDGPRARGWTHDAHAPSHVALEVESAGLLLCGDMLSDDEIPMPDDDDLGLVAYAAGLDLLADVVRRTRLLVPGHGSPTDRPLERLDADRRYLDAVMAGREVDDPRLAGDGMREQHALNQKLAAASA